MNRRHGIILLLPALLFWVSTALATERIVVAGTGDGQEMFEHLAEAFEKRHPEVDVVVPPSIDSGGGIRATAAGRCDLGRVARALRGKEENLNLNHRFFAHYPVAIAVHPSLERIENLTTGQLLDILTGRIANWSDVGGPDAKVYLVQREKGDAARQLLEKALPGFKSAATPGYIAYSADEAMEKIRQNPHTLGYITYQAAASAGLHLIEIDGVALTEETAASGAYPLRLALGFVWRDDIPDSARRFLEFAFSPEGRTVVRAHGGVPYP